MPVVGVAVTAAAVEGGSGGGALGRMMGVSEAAVVLSNLLRKLSLTPPVEGGLVMEDGATTTLV